MREYTAESCYCWLEQSKVMVLLSNRIRNHIVQTQSRILLVLKGRFSNKGLSVTNWYEMQYSMKFINLRSKLWAVNFAIRFCGTVRMMKVMVDLKSQLFP